MAEVTPEVIDLQPPPPQKKLLTEMLWPVIFKEQTKEKLDKMYHCAEKGLVLA
jgi:hypothetical protein